MPPPVPDLAQVRLDNALRLFEEFVRATARHADAATLRGLEGRFAERIGIQPSYWSQIKNRSRQIGERLARQFEQRCHKPAGWLDQPEAGAAGATVPPPPEAAENNLPRDDDERFIVGLVLTYYRRHPLRARARLLDLLGEVLAPAPAGTPPPGAAPRPGLRPGVLPPPPAAPPVDERSLWERSQSGVAPLKRKR
ncbi:MAG: hypothetical protein ACOVQT_16380 [Rubrivivax sp.]|jgi:hypothetical protein